MPNYRSAGQVPHKRHTQFRDADGRLYHEELFSTQGFADSYALLYHVNAPTAVLHVETRAPVVPAESDDRIRRLCMFDTNKVPTGGDILSSRQPMLFNDEISLSVASPDRRSDFMYRNAMCDEFVYVGEGEGELRTPWGLLPYEAGDMIVIPRGTTQDWTPAPGVFHRLFIVESTTAIIPPARYLAANGQFAEHSPVCERDIKSPTLEEPRGEHGDFPVIVRFGESVNIQHLAHHPFDVVGWDGCLYPYAINTRDFEPLTRRIHAMPDEQQIFECGGAAICCFVTRLADYHPLAVPAPPAHSSVDVDEVIFNMGTTFFGWNGPFPGMMTFHPRGFPHGPKPGIAEATIGKTEMDLNAIMVDVFKPLKKSADSAGCDDAKYPSHWLADPVATR